jgi:hypothetical protein
VVGFVVLEVSLSDFYPEDERCVFFPSHLWRGKTGTDWKLKQAWCRKEKKTGLVQTNTYWDWALLSAFNWPMYAPARNQP